MTTATEEKQSPDRAIALDYAWRTVSQRFPSGNYTSSDVLNAAEEYLQFLEGRRPATAKAKARRKR